MASVRGNIRKIATALIIVVALIAGMLGGVTSAQADTQVTSAPTENSTGGGPSTQLVDKPESTTTDNSSTVSSQTSTTHPEPTEESPANSNQSSTPKDSSSPSVRSGEFHKVVFDTNGAFTLAPEVQVVQNNAVPARPSTDPLKTGYRFDGWFNGNAGYDFTTPVTTDMILTAHWTRATRGEWGLNPDHGPATGGTKVTLTPPEVTDSVQISAARFHSMALTSNGTIYTWGRNDGGALGDGTTSDRSKPVKVLQPKSVPSDFRFTQISMGYQHSVALGSDGNAYAWGNNGNGELGIGYNWGNKTTPVKVLPPAGAPADFRYTQIGAGYGYTAALGSDGNAYAWGSGDCGHLGTDDHGSRSRAGKVKTPAGTNPDFRFTRITVAEHSVFALGSDGNAYAWGKNSDGQLGDGTESQRWTPVKVMKPSSSPEITYTQISCIYGSTLALGSDGNAYGWGANESGQLGNGNKRVAVSAVKVAAPATAANGFRYIQVSAGHSHSLAIGSDGNAYAWGSNQYGRLGNGSNTSSTTPVKVRYPSGSASDFKYTQVSAGIFHSMATGSDGKVLAWGRNTGYQVGNGNDDNQYSPVAVSTPKVSSGSSDGISVSNVRFDGIDSITVPEKQGDGTWLVTSPKHDSGVVDVSIVWTFNGSTSIAHLSYQYEQNYYTVTFDTADGRPVTRQRIKEGDYVKRPSPDPVRKGWQFDGWFLNTSNIAYDFARPVTGDLTLTAHWYYSGDSGNSIKDRMNGSAGFVRENIGNSNWSMKPTSGPESGGNTVRLLPPTPRGVRFSSVSVGDHHTVAVGSDGNVYAWGSNKYGQLGNGTVADSATPHVANKPTGKDDSFTYISAKAGEDFTVALGSDYKIYAWGNRRWGQLGDYSHQSSSSIPVQVLTPGNMTFQQIDAGATHALAVSMGGKEVWGWGNAQYGRLGNGDGENATFRSDPSQTKLTLDYGETVKTISAGSWHSVVITSKGRALTFGSSNYGQLGLGNQNDQLLPAEVPKPNQDTSVKFTDASAGGSHTLFLGSDGNVYGVGMNSWGQLGNGRQTEVQLTLTRMLKPQNAPNVKYVNLSAGGYHSLMLSSDYQLYGCGYNGYGQLGNNSTNTMTVPVKVFQPDNKPDTFKYFPTIDAGLGTSTVSAFIGEDGYVYSFGSNEFNALGNNLVPDKAIRPVRVLFPERGTLTDIIFDTNHGTIQNHNSDESWNVIVPEHNQGEVSVTVVWNLSGVPQTDQYLTYKYLHVGSLPKAGDSGIIPLILTGFLVMGGTIAVRRYRTNRIVGNSIRTQLHS